MEDRKTKLARKAARRLRWHEEGNNPRRIKIALKVGLFATESYKIGTRTMRRFIIPSLGA